MTSKLAREWLQHQISAIEAVGITDSNTLAAFKLALAAMDSESGCLPLDYLQGHKDGLEWAARLAEANHPDTGDWLYDDPIELAKAIRKGQDMPPAQPVEDSEPDRNSVLAYADSYRDMAKQGVESVPIWSVITDLERNIAPLYRHAQQPVVPDDVLAAIQKVARIRLDLNDFDGDRRGIADCLCDAEEALIEVVNRRAAMLQAQSEDDDGEPTDDERIMAIEGIHNCERCGDEGWIVGEMGITSCACGQAGTLINEGTIQAGNYPVITGAEQRIADAVELLQKAAPAMLADNSGPDGPLAGRLKSPVIPNGSAYMLRRWLAFGRGMQNAGSQLPHNLIAETESMLAAATHDTPALNSVQNVATVPDKWIPVSERMPPSRHEVLVGRWWGEKPQWCCKWATYIPGHPDAQSSGWLIPGASWMPTHWMPLPSAPQEGSL